jgi:hypothetical protein
MSYGLGCLVGRTSCFILTEQAPDTLVGLGLVWIDLILPVKSGSRGTRADQGVRPTLNGDCPYWEKVPLRTSACATAAESGHPEAHSAMSLVAMGASLSFTGGAQRK